MEAMFYEKLEGNKVQCKLCPRNCIILKGKTGYCGVRENKEGKRVNVSTIDIILEKQ